MNKSTTINYDQLSEELDQILADLQNDSLDIEKASQQYERGMVIINQLQTYLKKSQNKVEKLKKQFEN